MAFTQLMGESKPSLFINRAADFFFSKETLLESSVTGQLSHRSKDKDGGDIKQLDQNTLLTISGMPMIFKLS